ncbi:hypothetical protein C7H84_34150 [Burkholderia sp. Nafp2/4-1b]|uniref:hypothetical protein n=1 Tax=Burkholderia sp. Nafp2/4-1b TaxID=2116686 RepID=UPI000EF8CD33|nr:hypothetical protein [Burkholderia sp. Nafp2/4-1b]RKT98961.1 hypothetical protein C7H84_34150 [Burkholderia sp. Nafp2/4-1b]
MSAKFPMKLVIDDVTCPFLFARLSAVESPRARAALLRTLAEAACRGTVVEPRAARGDDALDRPAPVGSDKVTEHGRNTGPAGAVDVAAHVRGPDPLPTDNGHDTSAIADQFSAFY